MPIVAGHTFRNLTAGERCQGENCEGIQSLVELLALDGIVKATDRGIAHIGSLSPDEVQQIGIAAKEFRAAFEKVFG